uniref:tetratricopeptide repeat-containing sensor histidine kinase n=1 Tax=Fulvivirga sp. TaxID=1931237 RepID=UPI00404B89F1
MRLILLFILIQSFDIQVFGQRFSPDSTQVALEELSEEGKIDYINKNFYSIYSADFDNAKTLTDMAIHTSNKKNWKHKEAQSNLNRGVVTYLSGDYENALLFYQRALFLFDSLQDKIGMGNTYNEMAVFYHKTDNLEKAYDALDASLELCEEAGNETCVGTSLSHRITFLIRKGELEEAKPYMDQVLEIRIKAADSVGLGYIYLNLAEYEAWKGNLAKANALIERSTMIRQQMGDLQGVAVNTVIVGEMYFANENYSQAINYFNACIQKATPIGFTDLIRFANDMIEKSYANLGDYKNAYRYQQISHAYGDSLFNIEKAKTVAELEAKFENQKKEQQLAMQVVQLQQKEVQIQQDKYLQAGLGLTILLLIVIGVLIRKQMQQKQKLAIEHAIAKERELQITAVISSQERERNRFARDLHDTFGQLISVLKLNLSSLKESRPTKDKREQVFESSSKIIQEMYSELKNTCFDLMPQSLIMGGLIPAIEEFVYRINITGKIKVETNFFEMEDRLVDLEEISLFRITQEWVNNILKYSDASKITIQLIRDEEEITLMVEDNGSGFDSSILTSGKGNGWKNLQSRANLVKGSIHLDTVVGRKGNTLVVNVPVLAREKVATAA